MNRYLLFGVLFLSVNLLASAQQAKQLSISHAVQLMDRNALLIEKLVQNSLTQVNEKDNVQRSESYRPVLELLQSEMLRSDSNRRSELVDHARKLIQDGLKPNIKAARDVLSPGHPDLQKLDSLESLAQQLLPTAPPK